jgi:hypothetical protein
MMNSEDYFDEFDYPGWVYKELVEDYLPWEQGEKVSFIEFNKKYTLHDSGWIGIFFNVAYEQTATLARLSRLYGANGVKCSDSGILSPSQIWTFT